jgi:hypothetical protein
MKASMKLAAVVATSLMSATLFTNSAKAEGTVKAGAQIEVTSEQHYNNTDYRDNDRYDRNDRDDRNGRYDRNDRWDRNGRYDQVGGVVERIDHRRNVIVLREARSGRTIMIDADRIEDRRRNRADLTDLRRGDFVRLTGEWRHRSFEAYRIDDVRSNRNRDRDRW